LDLDGFQVVSAELVGGEWQLEVQTTATVIGCAGCGVRATPHGRRTVGVRDLPAGGRPVVLWWRKRLWRCGEPACKVRTWTERAPAIGPRAVLTERARAEACRRVGKDAHAVAAVAHDLGIGWATIMRAVADHGTPLVDDPARLDGVATLGLDETSFLKATRLAPTRWVTGLVDLEQGRLLDVVADRTRAAVDRWLAARPRDWLAQVGTVALDPWRGYASALVAPLGHARVVVDHAIKLANTVVDQVRRRTQQATLGHRGRKRDPLYRIRKLLLTTTEQLTSRGRVRLRAGLAAGDPGGEVAVAWRGKEWLRAVYAAGDLAHARAALGLLPLVGRRRGGGAVQACPHRQGVGGRNPGLPHHRRLLQRRHRGREPAGQEGHAGRSRLPQLRQLPAAAAAALWRHVADSPHRKTARPLPTLGGVEPLKSLRSVLAPTVRGAPGSRVPLTNGLPRTRKRRRQPDGTPISSVGWPATAMGTHQVLPATHRAVERFPRLYGSMNDAGMG
jgi:hypothetical protein